MIIVPTDDKATEAQAAQAINVPSYDPPPIYTPPSQSLSSDNGASSPTVHPLIKPSNYVSISRNNGSVKGTWVIDPALAIPTSLLTPLSTEETRKNFDIETRNGLIEADVSFAPYDPNNGAKPISQKRMTFYAKSSNGAITLKLHAPYSPRLPFYVNSYASNGPVHIHIPRSFHGIIVITSHNGPIKFSAATSAQLLTVSDVKGSRKCFIGDYSQLNDDEGWQGDEVTIEARNGPVKVQYDDETSETMKGKSGFLGRLFGF